MNDAAPTHHWFTGRRLTDREVDPDPADLGTAFGLDLSLNEIPHEPVAPPADQRPGWVQRLKPRRKSDA